MHFRKQVREIIGTTVSKSSFTCSSNTVSQTTDYYRSRQTGNWNAPATWESATNAAFTTGVTSPATLTPDYNANTITILTGHTVTITADVITDQTTVNSGGALIVNPNIVLTLNDDVSGTDLIVSSGGSMTIQSTSAGTGSIGNSGTATVSGNVTVERYLSSQNNRAYRLLGSSVNTSTSIHANWQEGATSNNPNPSPGPGNPNPGYGTHITGTRVDQTNGFDGTGTGQGSLFTYNQSTNAYVAAGSTNGTFNAKIGYLIYIRGDRSIDLTSQASPLPSTNTTLRATGALLTGLQTFSGLALNGGFSLVTNPYASALNWNLVYGHTGTNHSTNFENYYTYVDPNIGTRGGYVTVNTSGTATPDPAYYTGPAPIFPIGARYHIQSGQAFFVKTKSGINNPSLVINESDKSSTNNFDIFRTATAAQKFTAMLYFTDATLGRRIADGVTALYDNTYTAALDGNDAEEIANFDENIAINRTGTHLSIEERPLITTTDSLPLFMSNMKQQAYEFEFNPTNFAPNMIARLVDKYTGNSTYLDITAKTIVPFTVTADPASSAADRFTVLFSPSVALPVTLSSVKAYQKGTGVQVEWTTQQESNMSRYEVERSQNGQSFSRIGSVAAKGNSSTVLNYNFFDAAPINGTGFYRIRSVDIGGKGTYSQIVKVNISSSAKAGVTISPNPVTGNSITLQLTNLPKGIYTIALSNKLGQQIAGKVIDHQGGSATETLEVQALATGLYQMKITGNGSVITRQVIKK